MFDDYKCKKCNDPIDSHDHIWNSSLCDSCKSKRRSNMILVAIICGIVGILVGGLLGMMIFAGVNIKYGIGFIQSAGSIPLWITIFSCFRFRDWFVGEKG